jgi:Fe-S cluster biogenesis protein NfuA
VFIATEPTPNPEALKFIPHVTLAEAGSWSFERAGFAPGRSALAARIFEIAGVRRVYVATDFLTVTREPDGPEWSDLRYPVIAAIADHLQSGEPAVAEAPPAESEDEGVEGEIRQVLGLHVRPGVARDGGEVVFDRFDPSSGVLWIRMQGACGGCPSARLTLKAGVERIVRRYVPEVTAVEETPSEPSGGGLSAKVGDWMKRLGEAKGQGGRTLFSHGGRPLPLREKATAS